MKFLLNNVWLPIVSVLRFDRQFYNNAYSDIEGRNVGIIHFIRKGIFYGYKPCEGLDPILFRLNPTKYCKNFSIGLADCNHSLLSKQIGSLESYRLQSNRFELEKLQYYREFYLSKWVREIKKANVLSYRQIVRELKYIEFSNLENALVNNTSFALVRLPHGFWDALFLRDSIVNKLLTTGGFEGLRKDQLEKLVTRFLRERLNERGVFAESFFETVLKDIAECPNAPAFHFSISLKGFPTFSDSPFPIYGEKSEIERLCTMIFGYLDNSSYVQPVYDATIVKKWLITGELIRLPTLLEDKNVVLVGPDFLGSLGGKWKIKNYTHIKIPSSNTHDMRYNVLEEIISRCRNSDERRVFLFQCGASLAFWFISRLFTKFPYNIYMDIGQAVSAWYPETLLKAGQPRPPNWYLVYKDYIDANIDMSKSHFHTVE